MSEREGGRGGGGGLTGERGGGGGGGGTSPQASLCLWGGGGTSLPPLGTGGVKYRMLHIPGSLDCTYHLHVSVSVCSRF